MIEQDPICVAQVDGGIIVTIRTHLVDVAQVDRIGEALFELVARNDQCRLLLDFSAIEFLSSMMIGVLIKLESMLATTGGQLTMCGLRPEVSQIFVYSKLDKFFTFAERVDEALGLDETTPTRPATLT